MKLYERYIKGKTIVLYFKVRFTIKRVIFESTWLSHGNVKAGPYYGNVTACPYYGNVTAGMYYGNVTAGPYYGNGTAGTYYGNVTAVPSYLS